MAADSGPAFDVIVCGGLSFDILIAAPHLPGAGETAIGTDWDDKPGGAGFSAAMATAAAGASTAMIGRIGPDPYGGRLIEALEAAGVHAAGVTVDPAKRSGVSLAIVDYAGISAA